MFKLGHGGNFEKFHITDGAGFPICGGKYGICFSCNPNIQFSYICKSCLSHYTNKEIEELKFWLILRKLKK